MSPFVDALRYPSAEPLSLGVLMPALLAGGLSIGGGLLLTALRRRNRRA